jgi:hypothetical protein
LLIQFFVIALVTVGFKFLFEPSPGLSAQEISEGADVYLPLATLNCWPDVTPAGALPEQPDQVLCIKLGEGPDTSTQSVNAWRDEFNHGLSFGGFQNTNYKIYNALSAYKSAHWRHANHWMVDLMPKSLVGSGQNYDKGAAMMRPNRSFTFENGKLIVETDVAAGLLVYGEGAWPEIIVTTAAHPSGRVPDGTYAYDMFPTDWTFGCRLQANRHPTCALKKNDGNNNQAGTQVWEMSWFQKVGTYVYGGNEYGQRGNYWRLCQIDEPDINCRDRFRLELTRTSVTLYVNGLKYFQQTGIPPLPNALVNGQVYVYLASAQVSHPAVIIRYHWDRLTINTDQPPSAVPGFDPPSE